jgi:crotonobetainyl-CoA:carnitine CoA-transferase CaiB-like acyl-CoA transferase
LALIPELYRIFDKAPASEWLRRLSAEDIPASAIHTVGEALTDPQALARGLVVEIKHPTLDVVRSIANPVRLSSTPVLYRLPPPLLGEHTLEILQGLDYSNEEIVDAMREHSI